MQLQHIKYNSHTTTDGVLHLHIDAVDVTTDKLLGQLVVAELVAIISVN